MDSRTFVFLLLIGCLIVGCCMAAPQGCQGGFFAENGDLHINTLEIEKYLECINKEHQRG
ncbi:uncharacterized protein LOC26534717 [Drosophila yakuba]|uniref:Uncharacterized protein n=1 Tax=Drosophila yakuba TaxID=7245 RepID=A0A0R1DN05_DROYA|nr:uncharacterized protein LOC26534717 [Drosophila yakuba]KRJ98677.1 uncharacterized protein Dyak_GE27536 [Drosophila yakuba]